MSRYSPRARQRFHEGHSDQDDITRSLLAHDNHFLERTMRFEGEEMERAMRLYHHSAVVRKLVPERLRGLPEHDRAAIALSDAAPSAHVIVSREGAFVTCLTASMSTGRAPVLPYEAFRQGMEVAEAEHEEYRVVRRQESLLSGKDLVSAILRGPGSLSREMVQVIEMHPLTYLFPVIHCFWANVRVDCEVERLGGMSVPARARRHIDRHALKVDARMRICLFLLGAMEHEAISGPLADMLREGCPIELDVCAALARHRGGGECLFEIAFDLGASERIRHVATRGLLYHGALYPRDLPGLVQRALVQPGLADLAPLLGIEQPISVLEGVARMTPEDTEVAYAAFRQQQPPLPEPPEGSCWLFGIDELHSYFLHQAPISALFPPEACCKEVRAAWDRALQQPPSGPRREKGTPVVRQAPRIGRNDPCPCGSGNKYKLCCLASPRGPAVPA